MTELPDEDDVLRRMLNTPHEKHKPLREQRKEASKPSASPPREG